MREPTIADITPLAFCIQTDDLFDFKNFQSSFGDYLLLRERDQEFEEFLIGIKRRLSLGATQQEFLEGYKAVLIRNLDKIMSLVEGRYSSMDKKTVDTINTTIKQLIRKILVAEDFQKIQELETTFRRNVMLQVYSLFLKSIK
ncbi:MAG: hypothetical protein RMJ18_02395 [Candidatus Aenigmarchaeota archaeon]|nr:hypothetical protein [Candidatus Aenigmarchaeota archaeon]MCX8190961.1 hypothetical protein [Candidatus Aenigmarchaeota archaeon]MDW8160244.1 hypothetical protein [Candidatus Aenigmarchaeota archaeon]